MTYEEILKAMRSRFYEMAGYEADDASDVGIRLKVLAGELSSLYTAADWLKAQCFAQTACGEMLDRHAMERGLVRKPGLYALGVLRFERAVPLWYDAQIPKGTVCSMDGEQEMRFVTTQAGVLSAGQLFVDIPAQAESPGRAGNAAAGCITKMVTPPEGIQFVKNKVSFSGGENAEEDETVRARLLAAWRGVPNGANVAFYENIALQREEVRSAQAVAREHGAGTVGLYAAGRAGALSQEILNEIQTELNVLREVNVAVTVRGAQEVPVDLSLLLSPAPGVSFPQARSSCEAAVKKYFDTLTVGEPVLPHVACSCVFFLGRVKNCRPAALFSSDVAVGKGKLAVCGTLTITELTP